MDNTAHDAAPCHPDNGARAKKGLHSNAMRCSAQGCAPIQEGKKSMDLQR
jgi:hypothetical protein